MIAWGALMLTWHSLPSSDTSVFTEVASEVETYFFPVPEHLWLCEFSSATLMGDIFYMAVTDSPFLGSAVFIILADLA